MNLGFGELLLILVIAFVVVGPNDLPKVARAIAKVLRQLKGMYAEVKSELDLDTELSQIKDQVRTQTPALDDLSEIRREIRREIRNIKVS